MAKNVLIIGRGAVAVALAARLTNAKLSVVLADKYGVEKNISVTTFSSFDQTPVGGEVNYAQLSKAVILSCDLIIVCTKLFQLQKVYNYINTNGGYKKKKVFVQNGFVEDLIDFSLNDNLAILDMACQLVSPKIAYTSIFNSIHLSLNTPNIVKECFYATGFNIILHERLLYVRLRKFLFACTSAWMAVHNLSIEEAFFIKRYHTDLQKMLNETKGILVAFSQSSGDKQVAIELKKLNPSINNEMHSVDISTGSLLSYTSLFQDLERRNGKTEIEHLNGKLCFIAMELSIPYQCNSFLYKAVKMAQNNHLTPVELESRLHRLF